MKKLKVSDFEKHRLYILVRTDLPSMNPGRAMAQAAHASNQFIFKYGNGLNVKKWQADRGFGTTIVLGVTQMELENAVDMGLNRMEIAALVYDPTYSYTLPMEIAECIDRKTYTDTPIFKANDEVTFFRKELTCGYIFISNNSPHKQDIVNALPLHP